MRQFKSTIQSHIAGPRQFVALAFAAAAVVGMTAAPTRAEFITNSNGIVLKDDFEAPVGDGTGYQIGDSPTSGPWTVNLNGGTDADNYATISQVAGSPGQAVEVYGAYSHITEFRYSDTAYHNYAQEYYYQWDWRPGVDTTAIREPGLTQTNKFIFADSSGRRSILEFGVNTTYVDGDPTTGANHFYVITGEGTKTLSIAVPSDDWTTIQLHLKPENVVLGAAGSWTYSLWIDGKNQVLNQAFTAADSQARKADVFDYMKGWQDHAKSYIDNFSWRTDHFETPVPEPGSLALLGLGGLVMLRRR